MRSPNIEKDRFPLLFGMIGTIILASLLLFVLNGSKVNADKSFYPEPDPRPEDVPDYVVWDSETGEYVRKGYTIKEQAQEKESEMEYAEAHIDDPDPAEERLAELGRSDDPIDRAIYICANYPGDDSFYSSISANDSEAILEGIKVIPISAYPQVWERACTEPAGRALKLVALENFLDIHLGWGLYDIWAQKQWYLAFVELKHSLPDGVITEDDAESFGRLLIPLLKVRFENGALTDGEAVILAGLLSEGTPCDPDGLEEALDDNAEAIASIEQILTCDYDWVKQFDWQ